MRGRAFFGLLLVLVGAMLLLGRFGYLEWYRVLDLLRYWPLVLIAFGIGLLFPRNQWLLPAVLAVLVVGAGVYLVVGPDAGGTETADLNAGPVNAEGLTEARTDLTFAAGELNVMGDAEHVADLHASYTERVGEPQLSYTADGERARVVMSYPRSGRWGGGWPSSIGQRHDVFDLRLNNQLIHDLEAEFAAGLGDLDLELLSVRSLKLDMAAGQVKLILGVPAVGNLSSTAVDIEMAAGQITMNVPEAAGVSVMLSKVAGSTNLDQLGWRKDGDTYYSPDYDSADYQVQVRIDLVAGEFLLHER